MPPIVLHFAVGLLGMIFTYLMKLQSLKKDFAVAKQPFVMNKFFEAELIPMITSFVSLIIFILVLPEVFNNYPQLSKWTVSAHLFGGAAGTWVLSLWLGRSKKFIRGVMDTKTTLADEVIKEKSEQADRDN